MSGILGVIHWDGAPVEAVDLEAMAAAAAHRGPDGVTTWREGGVGLGHLALHLTPESAREDQPLVRDGLVLVADARLDNRDELTPLLRSKGHLSHEAPGDPELILAAYRAWGVECASRLVGDFAFAIWDAAERTLFAARDPMAMRPFYYREEPGRTLFGSEAKQILAMPGVPARLFRPALLAHMAGPYGRAEWSFFEGIRQLPPGHAMTARPDGVRTRPFWEVDPEARIRYRREGDYAEHFRALFEDAVAVRLRSRGPVGLLLSGGVDSGSIASMAGWLLERGTASVPEFRAYCWAFDELRDSDERGISDVIVDRYGLRRTDVLGDDWWPLRDFPEHGPDRDDPHLWVYQALHDHSLDRARAEGMGTVLTGDRGDEVVGDWVHDFAGMFLAGRWPLLRREIRAVGESPARALRRRVLRPLLAPAEGRRLPDLPLAPWLRPGTLQSEGLDADIFGPPPGPQFGSEARRLRYERIFHFAGTRIALANERRRAVRGLGFADPWSDVRLIRFVLSIPQWLVTRASEPKRLAREAMRGIVPESVRARTGKTIPHGLYERGFRDRARGTVRELLRDPVSARLGLVDAEGLRREYEGFLAGRPSRHDFWWPLSAEIWLRQHWS